jgi:hypothetical protein
VGRTPPLNEKRAGVNAPLQRIRRPSIARGQLPAPTIERPHPDREREPAGDGKINHAVTVAAVRFDRQSGARTNYPEAASGSRWPR